MRAALKVSVVLLSLLGTGVAAAAPAPDAYRANDAGGFRDIHQQIVEIQGHRPR